MTMGLLAYLVISGFQESELLQKLKMPGRFKLKTGEIPEKLSYTAFQKFGLRPIRPE
jgi:hypothetical protein